jgi:Peptidase family M50
VSKTPILDCEEPVPDVRAKSSFRYLLIGGGIGVAIVGLYRPIAGKPLPKLAESPLRLWLGCLLAFYIAVLVHELGHLIAGIVLDFEFRGIGVGVFFLDKAARGFKFRFVPRRIVAGGYTLMFARSTDDLVRRSIWLTAGGPLASVLLLIVTMFLPWSHLVAYILAVNVLLMISGWIPYAVRGQPNDAKSIQILARKGPDSDRLAAILYLLALNARGIEPRDWPRELSEKVTMATTDTTFRGAVHAVRCIFAYDGGDPETIAAALELALAWSHEGSLEARRGWFADASYFQGVFRNNSSFAKTWLRRAHKVKGAVSSLGRGGTVNLSPPSPLRRASSPRLANIFNATSPISTGVR